jgi:hypothetical protein
MASRGFGGAQLHAVENQVIDTYDEGTLLHKGWDELDDLPG